MDIGYSTDGLQALSRHVLQQIVAASAEAILLLDARDPELKVVYANPAYEALSGFTSAELLGAPWRVMRREGSRNRELDRLEAAFGCAEPCRVTLPDIRKNGASAVDEISMTPLTDSRGELRLFLCACRPLPERAPSPARHEGGALKREPTRPRQRLASLDRQDSATGLMRYEHFVSLLARDLAIARRAERSVAMLLFEIVDLDIYRQTFGSNAADSCLRMIGAQLTGAFRRAGDLCARCGESTLIAVVQGQDERQAAVLAERVAEKVRGLGLHNPRARSGRYVHVRSAVVADVPGSDDAERFIERARAKLRGDDAPAPAPDRSYAVS